MRQSLLRRLATGLLAGLALAAIGLVAGSGSATAFSPCHDEPSPKDTFVNVNDQTFAGLDVYTNGVGGPLGFWACAAPVGGEPAQRYVVVTVFDRPNSSPGAFIAVGGCGVPTLGNDPHPWTGPCPSGDPYVIEDTGAEVEPPTPATNLPGGGDGTGASAGGGSACVAVNDIGAGTCPLIPAIGVTVAEQDIQPGPGLVPTGVLVNTDPQKLVTVTAGPTTVSEDFPGGNCVGICP